MSTCCACYRSFGGLSAQRYICAPKISYNWGLLRDIRVCFLTLIILASPAGAADIAQVTADFISLGDRLGATIDCLDVARASRRLVLQNFALALGYNVVAIPLAMAGLVTPLIAAIAMSGSSIIVTLNALRLKWIS